MVMGAKRLGYGGAKRLELKIEAKRLGGKWLGGKRLVGETSCYRCQDQNNSPKLSINHSETARLLELSSLRIQEISNVKLG